MKFPNSGVVTLKQFPIFLNPQLPTSIHESCDQSRTRLHVWDDQTPRGTTWLYGPMRSSTFLQGVQFPGHESYSQIYLSFGKVIAIRMRNPCPLGLNAFRPFPSYNSRLRNITSKLSKNVFPVRVINFLG